MDNRLYFVFEAAQHEFLRQAVTCLLEWWDHREFDGWNNPPSTNSQIWLAKAKDLTDKLSFTIEQREKVATKGW